MANRLIEVRLSLDIEGEDVYEILQECEYEFALAEDGTDIRICEMYKHEIDEDSMELVLRINLRIPIHLLDTSTRTILRGCEYEFQSYIPDTFIGDNRIISYRDISTTF